MLAANDFCGTHIHTTIHTCTADENWPFLSLHVLPAYATLRHTQLFTQTNTMLHTPDTGDPFLPSLAKSVLNSPPIVWFGVRWLYSFNECYTRCKLFVSSKFLILVLTLRCYTFPCSVICFTVQGSLDTASLICIGVGFALLP